MTKNLKALSGEGKMFEKEEEAIAWYMKQFPNKHLSKEDIAFLNKYTDSEDSIRLLMLQYLDTTRGNLLDESHPTYREYDKKLWVNEGITLEELHDCIKRLDNILNHSRTPETVYVYNRAKISPYFPDSGSIRNQQGKIELNVVDRIWKNSQNSCRWPEFYNGALVELKKSNFPIILQFIVPKGAKAIYHYNPKNKAHRLILSRNSVSELGKMTVVKEKNNYELETLKIYSVFKYFD